MRSSPGHAAIVIFALVIGALVIGALLSPPVGPAHAMFTTGTIDPHVAPPWIAITEPRQSPFPTLDPFLPPQIERVLMLDLDGRSDRSVEAAIDALFAVPAEDADGGWLGSAPALHPEPLATFALMLVLGGAVGYRLRSRRRRAWRARRARRGASSGA